MSGFFTSEIILWEGEAHTEPKAREGEAPAEPKISANREMGNSAGRGKLRLTGRFALPLVGHQSPTNELAG